VTLRINFISNLGLDEKSGGWSGINVALLQELTTHFDVRFVGPINPPSDYPAKIVSKFKRVNGRAGSFHFFSDRRLQRIAKLVADSVDVTADCDFFHGATPWILFKSARPYFLYLDTCFSTYVKVYHDALEFQPDDLDRIFRMEADWLQRATQVFFGTSWAMEQALADYPLVQGDFRVVGAAGSMVPPAEDLYAGGMNFLFVALDFVKKGGAICVEAFQRAHSQFPEASLTVVGERPPLEVLAIPGVYYAGFLRKSIPAELDQLAKLYSSAFFLVHPTSADIQPLVISEAAYFGCPTIAANSFGIPELVTDGVNGFLVDPPLTSEAFADRMLALCNDRRAYLAMRYSARSYAVRNLTWQAVGNRIAAAIRSSVETSAVETVV
jgi:glycosyltransferase involved in cell wall biosynthesis